jgi:hypothetical protein
VNPNKILIVVFHTRQEPWESIVRKGQFNTWVPTAIKLGFKVAYCFGPKPSRIVSILDREIEKSRWTRGGRISEFRNIINRILAAPFSRFVPTLRKVEYEGAPKGVTGLRTSIWDMYSTARWRQLGLFKYFLTQTSCDFLIIVTSATYLTPEKILENLENLKGNIVYAGPIHGQKPSTVFVSGAQVVVNREFAALALENKSRIPTHLLNDLGLGEIARIHAIEPQRLPTLNLSSLVELQNTTDLALSTNYHFRLKSYIEGTNQRGDVMLFEELHKRLNQIKK